MSVGGGAEEALVEDEDDAVVMRVDAEDADAAWKLEVGGSVEAEPASEYPKSNSSSLQGSGKMISVV